jgi:hypothetical protein
MRWVAADDFDVGAHVVEGELSSTDPDAVRSEVGRLFAERLDRSRPLWRIDVLGPQTGCRVLAWRLHHTVADGIAGMRYARALLWDEQAQPTAPPTKAERVHDEQRRRLHLARFFGREFARARSPFDGAIGARREVAFAALPLAPLHDAARRAAGATLNDAVVSTVAGGLRGWLEQHHGRIDAVRVKVPVSLHHAGDDLGNADSFFFVAVPLEPADPVARLHAVQVATAARKAEQDAETMDRLLRDLRAVSPRLAGLCERIERSARAFGVNVSNVPGPREPVTLCGSRVRSLHSIAEIAKHHAVRVAAVSLGDELFLGFCADPELVPGVESIAAATERDAAELIAAA